jgi:cobalt-zinc-cadmium efflux system outer membrane protein
MEVFMSAPLRRMFVCLILIGGRLAPAESVDCKDIATYKEAINCIARIAPDIQQAHLQVESAGARVDQARLFANPEIESNNFTNSDGSSGGISTETQLLFPMQLGGKRNARSQVATANKNSASALAQSTQERILIEAAEGFHRLRQLELEIELTDEAIHRFERIISAFRKRGQLNPEQQVSLTVFRYALEEEKQKKSQALADQRAIKTSLSLLMGQKLKITKEMFPKIPQKWPEISDKNIENFSELKLAKSRASEAKAELELAQANAWPDLKIGPAYERMPDQEQTQEHLGISISMELPVFNRNQGTKRAAEFSRQIAAIEAEQKAMAFSQGLESLLDQYKLITTALASSPSQAELEKGHRAFESQFKRGLVSYGLIIEAHRQLHETVQTKHQQELRALNLLWRIYQMTGKLSPEVL